MTWVIANTMSEYVSFIIKNKDIGRTRYVGQEEELYGIRGEVIILNNGHYKFDTTAHETLLAYKEFGLINIKNVYY